MRRRPTRSTRTDTPFPDTTLFRSAGTDSHAARFGFAEPRGGHRHHVVCDGGPAGGVASACCGNRRVTPARPVCMTAERQSIESRNAPSPAASLGGPTPRAVPGACRRGLGNEAGGGGPPPERRTAVEPAEDRKSTRLNSRHQYA